MEKNSQPDVEKITKKNDDTDEDFGEDDEAPF
jgi:hypothetical protein